MQIKNKYPAPIFTDIGDLKNYNVPQIEPVNEYLIPNALINSFGYIFKNFRPVKEIMSFRHRNSITLKNILSVYRKKRVKIGQPAISILHGWNDNFYHFTLECLPKLYVLKEHINNATIVFPKQEQAFHRDWIKILALNNVVFLDSHEILSTPLAISCTFTSQDLYHHPLIIPEFREWILSHIRNKKEFAYKKIFVGRRGPKRKLLNLDAVKSYLEHFGFIYLEMENFSLEQQIKIFASAEKIIALHGAALTHLCFAKPSIDVIDLMHKDHPQRCYLSLSKILNINYSIVECSSAENDKRIPENRDLIVDILKLSIAIKNW
jgi:capsular polysaccharide biosynthesis protein